MGTNYYLIHTANACAKCGRSDETRRHIGKSSAGWCFLLHVEPQNGIADLPDWEDLWSRPDTRIEDEYGKALTPADMRLVIMARSGRPFDERGPWTGWGYDGEADFHGKNHSERGPNGLLRHRIDHYCIGHGAGTWDLLVGEFL
jgi:hypothetical protein